MKKEESTFRSASGETLEKVCWLPEGQARGVVQIVHGMAEHISRYDEVGAFLANHGFAVVGHTHMGHGKNAQVLGSFGKNGWDTLLCDVNQLRADTQKRFPGVPYVLLGHSMGSFLTRCYLLDHGAGLTGAAISGTGWYSRPMAQMGILLARLYKLLGYGKKPCKPVDKIAFSAYNKHFQPSRTDFDWLSRDNEKVDAYNSDPLCGFIFTASGFEAMFTGLKRLTNLKSLESMPKEMPVYFFSGGMDPVGQQGKGVERVAQQFNCAGMKHVTARIYPEGRHEMLNEINRQEVMQDLLTWLEKTCG